MAIEKERKFLLDASQIEFTTEPELIEQAYLMLVNKDQLRVRISNNTTAMLCYKRCVSDTIRTEYEYNIPLEDAQELLKSTSIKLSKKRFHIPHEKHTVCIDFYPNGLKVVEIEFEEDLEDGDIPLYCGIEITGEKKYSNITIAKENEETISSTV